MKRKGRKRAGAALEWCGDEEGYLLLPGLDIDTALRCLAFVPSYIYPLLASLNKTYRSLIISAKCAPLMELRRTLGIVDHLLVSQHVQADCSREYETVHINGQEHMRAKIKWSLRALDLKRNTWMNLAVPHYIAFHNYDTFFCSGGHKTNGYELSMGDALSSAEIYNMRQRSWRHLPPMPAARDGCTGFIMDNKFYVIGGTDGFYRFVDAEEYDPSTKAWKTIRNMCLNASNPMAPLVAVHNNQLYAIDDKVSTLSNPSLHVYEKQTNTWRCLGPVLDKHGDSSDEGNLHMRNGGLVSMGCDKLLIVGEWWPRVQGDEKKTYILAWEASLEATVCEFKVVYSGPAERGWISGMSLLEYLGKEEVRQFRMYGDPWLAVVI